MSESSLYERVLAGFGASGAQGAAFPGKLRASAAVVLWRPDPDGAPGGGLEVFWMRRKPEMQFMGGWHAFPGGTVSREDAEASSGWIRNAPRGLDPDAITGALPETLTEGLDLAPDDVPGLLVATFRELFEETGLLPTADGLVGRSERFEAARAALLSGERSIAQVAEDLGVTVDASRLVFAGRWITPPLAPLRFDNRFFLLEHPRGAPEPAVPDEAAEAGWVRPEEAFALWRRGEVIAAPPILYVLRALAEAHLDQERGIEGALPRLREPVDANLGPYRRIDFRPGVIMIPVPTPTLPPASHTNAYLVGPPEGGEAVLVDPGTPFPREIERLEAAVQAASEDGDRPLKLTAIWLTHHHGDHVGAVRRLAERFGVPVAAHAETADRLDARSADPIRVDRMIEDGERFELAGLGGSGSITLRALHTPGHAPGHLCFYEEELGSLLAGDMLSAVSTIVIDPPDGDMDRYLASLERLAELDPRAIFPGHGPAILGGAGKLRELHSHRLWREAKVLEAWNAGTRRPADMLPTVYDDAPRQVWPLAERQIEAHLQRLARAGTIDRRGARGPAAP